MRNLSKYDGGTAGPAGPAGTSFTWRGAWVSGTSYAANDIISNGGSSYVCISATSGTTAPPSDATHWSVVAQQGSTGATGSAGSAGGTGPAGTSFTWKGAWISAHTYAINDVASNAGSSYICILATSGTTAPPGDATHWSLMAQQGTAGSAGGTGPAGTSFTWRGAWVSGTAYVANDVTSNGGSSYVCILATIGATAPPSDATHWSLMAQQGTAGTNGGTGPAGTSFTWRGAWVSGTPYALNDVTSNAGSSYICILAITGATAPPSDATHWSLMAQQGTAGSTGPTGLSSVRVTANVSQSTVTAASITGLSFPIGVSENWSFEANLKVSCSSTGGVKFAVTVPAGATVSLTLCGNTSAIGTYSTVFVTAGATQSTAFITAAITGEIWINGVIVNSTTAGTVQLQYAAGTATQTATIFANSYMNYHKTSN